MISLTVEWKKIRYILLIHTKNQVEHLGYLRRLSYLCNKISRSLDIVQ